jgi:hypothetical protein
MMNAKNSPVLHRHRNKDRQTVVDKQNEGLIQYQVQLHPTKGYRRTSFKRIIASQLVEMIKGGNAKGLSLRDTAVMINNAR